MQAYADKRNEEALKLHESKVARFSEAITGKQSELRSTVADYTKDIADLQRQLLELKAPKVLTVADLFGADVAAAVEASAQ
jgi:hypothetical protein